MDWQNLQQWAERYRELDAKDNPTQGDRNERVHLFERILGFVEHGGLESLRRQLTEVTAERDRLQSQSEPADVVESYRSIVNEWVGTLVTIGKYEAVHPVTVRKMMASISGCGLIEWARWLVWWHGHHLQQLETQEQWLREAEAERDRLRAELLQQPPTLEWLLATFPKIEHRSGVLVLDINDRKWLHYYVSGRIAMIVHWYEHNGHSETELPTRAAVLAAVAAREIENEAK